MRTRPDSYEQRRILEEIGRGRKIRPVIVRRGTNQLLRFGFSDAEPVHANALEALLRRGELVRRDGEIVRGNNG